MNYEIIKDEQILKDFIEWLPECAESEQFYVCLFARSKYCKESLVHISSDKQQLKRLTAKKKNLFDKIKQLECEVGSYKQRETPIPQEALALYLSINPRDLWKATFNSLVHLTQCIQKNNTTMNPQQEVMSEIQRTKGVTRFVIFDFDEKFPKEELLTFLESKVNLSAVKVLETRGGYHVLIETEKVESGCKKNWYQLIASHPSVDQKGDLMSPVPGCTQGGFIPKFI